MSDIDGLVRCVNKATELIAVVRTAYPDAARDTIPEVIANVVTLALNEDRLRDQPLPAWKEGT